MSSHGARSRRASQCSPAGQRRGVLTLALAAVAGLGAQCPVPLPPLATSEPPHQASGVSPAAWLTLRFAAAVPPESRNLILLFCDGAPNVA